MSEIELPKQARKGTKSCTECRRRKIRCIRNPEDAETCRSCEDRGLKCVAQIFSSRPLRAQRLPTRHRIAQLESEVAGLRKAVRNIQVKLGYPTRDIPEFESINSGFSPGEDESDEDSNVSDILVAEQPSHLRSLFQNDWLSVDSGRQDEQLLGRKAKASAQLLDMSRETLQKIIPSKEDVLDMARTASEWLDLAHAILPQPFAVKSQQELLESYNDMLRPDVDTMSLAAWLLDLAITAQQEPQVHGSPTTSLQRFHRVSDFTRAVCDAVENGLISHDRLLGTIQGLGMAMHFLRLQISMGNFHKAWIRQRHFIAIAELLGLSKAVHIVQPYNIAGVPDDRLQVQRMELWEFMCFADRLLGMVINRPPITRRFERPHAQPLTVNGMIQPQVYLQRLTDVTAKFHTLDDPGMAQGSSAQAYASALELDRQLRVLASQTPKAWWEQDMKQVKPENLCQLLHYYFMMRIHLPFTMRHSPGDGDVYSRLTCMEACEAVAQRYQSLRRLMPSGIFLSPILDLQAFTATIVLLLTSHSGPSDHRVDFHANKARVQDIAAKVLKVMDEKSRDTAGADFARHGAVTIRSLSALLQQSGDAAQSAQLSLKVPLLGNINIRRNVDRSQAPTIATQQPAQGLPETGLWKANEYLPSQPSGTTSFNPGHVLPPATQAQADWQWNPLSWSIEDNDNSFQDAFMADNLDQFGMWQGDYHNFQFNN